MCSVGEFLRFSSSTISGSWPSLNILIATGPEHEFSQVSRDGPIIAFDVSLRISDMPAYVAAVREALPRSGDAPPRLVVFGHLGDGNLHLIAPAGDRSAAAKKAVEAAVYGPLQAIGGSVSAEHGIGLSKRAWLPMSRSPEEIALMRTLKGALDPRGVLNPGKVVG